jgi:hypothetical protein
MRGGQRSYAEVAAIWNAETGESITPGHAHSIVTSAMQKIRKRLVSIYAERKW